MDLKIPIIFTQKNLVLGVEDVYGGGVVANYFPQKGRPIIFTKIIIPLERLQKGAGLITESITKKPYMKLLNILGTEYQLLKMEGNGSN